MISNSLAVTCLPSDAPAATWQRVMKEAVRDVGELCELLELSPVFAVQAARAAEQFPLFVPRPFLARMRRGDPHDPLLRQVLPLEAETIAAPGFTADPVGDLCASLQPGLLQKYQSRVLMVTTGACAVHCRYCFRRHFPYSQTPRSLNDWLPAIAQIEADDSIHEVILSGGDPLTLSDRLLAQLVQRLEGIGHLRRIRLHTRLPIVIPQRVNAEMLDWLTGSRLTPVVVVHVNHPAEIDAAVQATLAKLTAAGVPLLNQAVLLRGVNDDVEVLAELSERLIDLRVLPYYLHQLDRVEGGGHFEVPMERGRKIINELQERLPGYAVPRYVQEIPGRKHKVELI
jgi:EF-P beta-lysylation protein EpmB